MSIHLFKPVFHVEECLNEIRECLEKGWTGAGFKTVEFEEKWKVYTGMPHAHFINSATSGLHLAIKLLKMQENWQEDDEVISTPITFVSTNHAIAYEKLKVVFADVDASLCLDPIDVEKKITQKTRAVVFVGMGGNTGQYQSIEALCKKYNLRLILDAAHMSGTRLEGEFPGKQADAVVYSFQAVKNLPTADSGMVCFKEQHLDSECRKLSWMGISQDTFARMNSKKEYKWKYDVEYLGYKYNGNSIMAAIGLVQLKYLDADNRYRRQLAAEYDAVFSQYPKKIRPIECAKGCESSRHLYIIEVHHRDELMLALNEQGIYPGVHYRDNTEYERYAYAQGTCPNAARLSQRIVSLPMHLQLTQADIREICDKVIRYSR